MIKIGTSFKDYVQVVPQIIIVLLISDSFGGGMMCPPHHYQYVFFFFTFSIAFSKCTVLHSIIYVQYYEMDFRLDSFCKCSAHS